MKKLILILIPLLLLGGGTVCGLSMLGILNVPFLPFNKKIKLPPPDNGKGGPLAPLFVALGTVGKSLESSIAAEKKIVPPTPPTPPPDTSAGEAKLASLWAEMPTEKLIGIVDKWPQPQLGRILAKMDNEVITKLLGALPADRAIAISKSVAAATDERATKVQQT